MSFGGYLQANTAVDILIGPFVDDTDGKTAEPGLTIDVELSKNGQALANKHEATTLRAILMPIIIVRLTLRIRIRKERLPLSATRRGRFPSAMTSSSFPKPLTRAS